MTEIAIRDEQHYLATVREVRALAERCDTVEGAKDLADRAAAARLYAERAKLGGDMVNRAAAAKLWAERRAGELLAAVVRRPEQGRPAIDDVSAPPTLPELGVTRDQSSAWQALAEIPADDFADAIEQAAEDGAVTATKVRRIAKPDMVVPIDEELLARQQRETLIASLDRAIYALESPPSTAVAEAERLLAGGDAGPFTPDRFERVIAYCSAFAETLKGATA